jgi:hypothetical protein
VKTCKNICQIYRTVNELAEFIPESVLKRSHGNSSSVNGLLYCLTSPSRRLAQGVAVVQSTANEHRTQRLADVAAVGRQTIKGHLIPASQRRRKAANTTAVDMKARHFIQEFRQLTICAVRGCVWGYSLASNYRWIPAI